MIFGPEQAKWIKAGKKTMCRRVRFQDQDCRYKLGRVYAIQTQRGKPAIAHVTITGVQEQQLGQITLREARKEGFRTTQDFKDGWIAQGLSWYPSMPVWAISFELGDLTDSPRLLAQDSTHGYTKIPALSLTSAAEEVSEATQARYAADSAQRQAITLGERKERLAALIFEIRRHGKDPATNAKLRAAERRIRQIPADALYGLRSTG